MPKERLAISDSALKAVIEGYAREAGVRQLEKQLGKLVRKAVVKLLEDPQAVLKITPKDLESYLGKPVFRSEQVLSGVGVITGLAGPAWAAPRCRSRRRASIRSTAASSSPASSAT